MPTIAHDVAQGFALAPTSLQFAQACLCRGGQRLDRYELEALRINGPGGFRFRDDSVLVADGPAEACKLHIYLVRKKEKSDAPPQMERLGAHLNPRPTSSMGGMHSVPLIMFIGGRSVVVDIGS